MISLGIVRFCAEEVERQTDRPIAVWWMIQAWVSALILARVRAENGPFDPREMLTPRLVEEWGRQVEPYKNIGGHRTYRVFVGERVCPQPNDLDRLLSQLFNLETLRRLTPDEAYREFEEIHPFRDGNGRTGKIIYNWLRQTLDNPQMPPNFWGISNP